MNQILMPSQLGYLGLGVSDLSAWNNFSQNILGLEVRPKEKDGSLMLRMDEYHHRFILTEDACDDLTIIGWEMSSEVDLEMLKDRLVHSGLSFEEGESDIQDSRRVAKVVRFCDPNGIINEAYCAPLIESTKRFISPRAISGFLTGDQGLGHITITVDSLQESLSFYQDIVGLRISDWVRPQSERGVESDMNLVFLHCNQRHHSLAFWENPSANKRLHHFMVQAKELDDVGSTYYLCQTAQVPIDLSLGRHTNDKMLSFYMRSPSGFDVEFGWGAVEVDSEKWSVQLYNNGSLWGHLPPDSH